MIASWKDLCVDAVDPLLLGRFWADTLGRELRQRDDGLVMLVGATPQHTVWVNRVPEPVTVKQRVHLDVHASSHEEVLARGATELDVTSYRWQVLRDPEGGELCVFEREQVPEERLYEIVVDARDPLGQADWWAGVSPLLSPSAVVAYAGTDPAEVPAHRVTGAARVGTSPSAFLASVFVPTDAGDYAVLLVRADAAWPTADTIVTGDNVVLDRDRAVGGRVVPHARLVEV